LEQPVQAFDLQMMFFGDQPPLFLLEIVVRTLIIYVYTLLLLRWLGSRTIGQLSTVEFLLVIALGSAVGDAMFYPDVPLLHALLVVTMVVLANKLLDIVMARSKRAERAIDGSPRQAISKGVIDRKFLTDTALSTSELFQQLRHHGVEHLGQVAGAYVEPDGVLTVFRDKESRPGLPVAPPWEVEEPPKVAVGEPVPTALLACRRCGTLAESENGRAPGPCPSCEHEVWTPARLQDAYGKGD
jgi:uncharacterized membrane protein YcaP (DUF421 family)